jgi:hypothetical protein
MSALRITVITGLYRTLKKKKKTSFEEEEKDFL